MSKKQRIYLVSPKNIDNFWTMQGMLDVIGGKRTLMPNSALATLIALTPKDIDIKYIYCDENIDGIDMNTECDLVALTGYTLHSQRIHEIYKAFNRCNIPVALGGAFATLEPDRARKSADYLFIGEAEYTWPRFLKEWLDDKAKTVYEQKGYVDIKDSPVPDLSFFNARNYAYFTVQTSRGCPNNCDFCDVVKLMGRKYRTKSIGQIMTEVKNSYALGAETVFFSDDNFVVDRKFTIKLLTELIEWNKALSRPLSFSTQTTVQVGADEEILRLMADAKFSVLFIGLETTRKECLREVNKGQMVRFDPEKIIPKISSYGIIPFLGMIVGFDHDDASIFDEFERFLDKTSSPIASISILNAPKHTVLYSRMKKEGRLIEDFRGFWHFSTNIVPKQMSWEELHNGHRDLFRRIYEPENFEKRLINWLAGVKYFTPLYSNRKRNLYRMFKVINIFKHFLFRVPAPMRNSFLRIIKETWKINPKLISKTISIMVQYWHYYYFANKK